VSVSETFQLSAPTTTRTRSGLAALLVVLAIGLAVLVLLLSISTGGYAPHRVSGANAEPHLAR
jgi:hypothetical protein